MKKEVKKNSVKKSSKIKGENVEILDLNSAKNSNIDDEPSWYHYILVILILFGVILVAYFGFEYYDKMKKEDLANYEPLRETFVYPYKVGNITYNIEFHNTFDYIERHNVTNELKREDIWNSNRIIFAFYEYNGTDNRYVSTASVKLMSFFKYVYTINFNETTDFNMINESNCSTSTLKSKVVVFNPYSDRNGVFYNEKTGCIEILSRTPKEMVLVEDTLMYDFIMHQETGE